ncbi:MAG: hypothetical protein ABR606_20790 [Vicinamibacterales bacterium]
MAVQELFAYLCVRNTAEAIDAVRRVSGVRDSCPAAGDGHVATIHIHFDNADAVIAAAVEAGAKP